MASGYQNGQGGSTALSPLILTTESEVGTIIVAFTQMKKLRLDEMNDLPKAT